MCSILLTAPDSGLGHDAELARSTNHLLVVGFYLVNIGFITITLSVGAEPAK